MFDVHGTARMAAMFDELTIADEAEQLDQESARILTLADRDPELAAAINALIDLADRLDDVPPAEWSLDPLTSACLKRLPRDEDAVMGASPSLWLYRLQLAEGTLEGRRLCETRDARLQALRLSGAL